MANGIDRRYTGIPIIPQVVEEKTSMWDAIVPLAQMAKQEKLLAEKKELEWEKIRVEKKSNADMADYRAGVLSNQRTQESNLQLDRGEKNAIANKNAQAVQDQVKLKGKEAYYKGFPAYQRAQLQMRDPDYLRLTGTTKADYEPLLENYDNISDFVDNAGSLQFSKNLKKIDAAMKHANTFETKDPRLSALKLQLAEQYQTVKDVKEKEYEVTPAEIQEAYPEFAYQIKNIAMTAQAPEGDLKKLMEEGKLLEIAQRGIIPQDKLPAFNAQMTQLREFYQRKYRKEHDIGEYEKLIPFSQLTAAQKAQAGPHAETAAGQRAEEDPYMVPITGGEVGIAEGSYGISDKQYDLLEKTMETNEDLWDRWIGEDDYTFADLETDYEAGLRAETDEPTEKELEEAELKAQQVSVEREEPEVEPPPSPPAPTPGASKGGKLTFTGYGSSKTVGGQTLPQFAVEGEDPTSMPVDISKLKPDDPEYKKFIGIQNSLKADQKDFKAINNYIGKIGGLKGQQFFAKKEGKDERIAELDTQIAQVKKQIEVLRKGLKTSSDVTDEYFEKIYSDYNI